MFEIKVSQLNRTQSKSIDLQACSNKTCISTLWSEHTGCILGQGPGLEQ